MRLYIVEEYTVLDMYDPMLQDYDIFLSLQDAVDKYPDTILASAMDNEVQVDKSIEKELNRMLGVCYVIREKEI